jgi:hypothetical protein
MMLLLAAGCAAAPASDSRFPAAGPWTGRIVPGPREIPRLDRERVLAAIESAASQIKRCYRHPRIPSSGRRIATRLRLHFSPDGSLTGIPTVVDQSGVTEDNRAFAGRMAEAASQAVMRCLPVKLPPDLYAGGWDEMDLTFSPAMLV